MKKSLEESGLEYAARIFPKCCTCCSKVYSKQEWLKLNLVGIQRGFDGKPWAELRDCACKSTLVAQIKGAS